MSENRVFVFVPLEDYLCGISVHSKIDVLRFYVFWVHNSSFSLLTLNNSRRTGFEQRMYVVNRQYKFDLYYEFQYLTYY